jgi:hypothetical protein
MRASEPLPMPAIFISPDQGKLDIPDRQGQHMLDLAVIWSYTLRAGFVNLRTSCGETGLSEVTYRLLSCPLL